MFYFITIYFFVDSTKAMYLSAISCEINGSPSTNLAISVIISPSIAIVADVQIFEGMFQSEALFDQISIL